MNVLVLDGHPDEGRLLSALLDSYVQSLGPNVFVHRIAVRQLSFDPNLRTGYTSDQPCEPDLKMVGEALLACDHLVVGFPLWWGGEPAILKGLLDRIILPGFAFQFRRKGPFWDRLLQGRSADVIVTMDTPPLWMRWVYGDPLKKRWAYQVLGFCGFNPLRFFPFGPTRRGGAAENAENWRRHLHKAATTAHTLRRGPRSPIPPSREAFSAAKNPDL